MHDKLENHRLKDLMRAHVAIDAREKTNIYIKKNGYINFSANDYLGLTHCEEIKHAFFNAIEKHGFGSVSSALVSGYYTEQQQLEQAFANFLQYPRTLYVGSGYLANIAVLTAIASRNSVVISDKLSHASSLDGVTLSRAKHYRFSHNNFIALQKRIASIKKQHGNKNTIITTDGVFGMSGELCQLIPIVKIAEKNNATLIIDDAHGIGILGKEGRGIREYYNIPTEFIDCLVIPLSKAFAGQGAIIAGSNELIETIVQFAVSYRCTTAPLPAITNALLVSLAVVQQQTWRREKLKDLITFFNFVAKDRNLPLISENISPIKSFLLGNNKLAQLVQQDLQRMGFYTACIRPPSVPEASARLRISLSCHHDKQKIIKLLDCLQIVYEKYKK